MKFIATLLFGGALFAADLPNPEIGECIIDTVKETRTEPTMIDPDGQITGLGFWSVCSYQEPNGTGGLRTVDEPFWTEVDLDQAEVLVGGAAELVAADNDVFLSD